MKTDSVSLIAKTLKIRPQQVENTLKLLDEGATVPFISRYRKEMTGSLDEVAIQAIRDQNEELTELEKRRETILASIEEQGKLTADLRLKIENTMSKTELEDLYLPFRPKRKTKASVAREKGLEPLAEIIFRQAQTDARPLASKFVNEQVKTPEEALEGALDIVAEWINEDAVLRNMLRSLFEREALIVSKAPKAKQTEEAQKYRDYFDYSELLNRCPSHRFLAVMRGENEGFLKSGIEPPEDRTLDLLEKKVITPPHHKNRELLQSALRDAYKRLLQPSLENEFKALYKEKADEEAIHVFAENLRQLLLAPPLGAKRTLALDPGYRTGCKTVCLDASGELLCYETIFPHPPANEAEKAAKTIIRLISTYKIEAIAIGNGTAGRETETFVRSIPECQSLLIFMVSEAGASVYSASETAREEFPDKDVTVRGAVSIGRRLMDPLAELVKIDPKAIGVGQYQHDVDQKKLKNNLDMVVESSVNKVGVNLNTASRHLLTYVSGIGQTMAERIIRHRAEKGFFHTRKDLLKVSKFGEKTFEQAAGFLRVPQSGNPLDNSAVHPESYALVEQMAKDLNVSVSDLIQNESVRKRVDLKRYVSESVGMPTLTDIMEELAKPGRDPRGPLEVFEFSKEVHTLEDVKTGMILPGIVTNITKFGAFVDIGVKQDGLVHISQLADRFVNDPADVVKLHQKVKVKVLEADIQRKRISLSMKGLS